MKHSFRNKITQLGLVLAALFAVTSCDMMHADDEDCSTHLRVRFVYDRNMKFADAFSHEVKVVTLYAFGTDGRLAYTKTESAADITSRGGYMEVDDLTPGIYDLQVWAQGEERYADSYEFGAATIGQSEASVLKCRVARTGRHLTHDLTPLFHGRAEAQDLSTLPQGGVQTATVSLTKNTNHVRIVLQNLSGRSLSADDFLFTIDDENTYMDYDNSLLPADSVTYHEWAKYGGNAGVEVNARQEFTSVAAVVAELTVNRLMTDRKPRLSVCDKDGRRILSIPLTDYALLVKGNYNREMSDQEYLDRQDEYNLTFFLDENNEWMSASILVNAWQVVVSDTEMK